MTQVQTVNFFVMLIVTGIYGGYTMVHSKKVQVQKERRYWMSRIFDKYRRTTRDQAKNGSATSLNVCSSVKELYSLKIKILSVSGNMLTSLSVRPYTSVMFAVQCVKSDWNVYTLTTHLKMLSIFSSRDTDISARFVMTELNDDIHFVFLFCTLLLTF